MLMNAPLLQQLLTTRQDLAALFHKAVAYTIIVIKWTVECRRVVTCNPTMSYIFQRNPCLIKDYVAILIFG